MACAARTRSWIVWRTRATRDIPAAERIEARRREIAALLEDIRAPVAGDARQRSEALREAR